MEAKKRDGIPKKMLVKDKQEPEEEDLDSEEFVEALTIDDFICGMVEKNYAVEEMPARFGHDTCRRETH